MSKNLNKKRKKTLHERIDQNNGQLTQKLIDLQAQSDQKYVSRIKKRVETMLMQPYTYFFTFTLNDASIDISEHLHVKKIKATLSQATLYMINNDYGDKTDRLHYHALASFNHTYNTTFLNNYQYGFTNIKEITKKDAKSIYEYILKMTNHSIKKSVAKIWRSRKK